MTIKDIYQEVLELDLNQQVQPNIETVISYEGALGNVPYGFERFVYDK